MEIDKVDMSLDDIIKMNKKNKAGRGGRGGQNGGRGRGSRTFRRGGAIAVRGQGQRGRGRGGRGRGIGISPQNRQMSPRGGATRGRGRGQRVRGRGRGQGQMRPVGQQGQQSELRTQGITSLNRRRQQAITSLMKAKQTLAQLNARQRQHQKLNRSQTVMQRRGLQPTSPNTTTGGRGRGRGRGLTRYNSTMSVNSVGSQSSRGRGNLRRFGSTVSVNSVGSRPGRGRGNLQRFGSTMSVNSVGSRGRGRGRGLQKYGSTQSLASVGAQKQRKQWRKPRSTSDDSPLLTVSVRNSQKARKNKLQRYKVNDTNPSLQAQIAALKPAVSVNYQYKKALFSQATTSVTLNDRFSASTSKEDKPQSNILGRKVFF